MDRSSYDSTTETRNLDALIGLHAQDPYDLYGVPGRDENLLHVAVMFGQTEFAKEIIRRRPEFIKEKNKDGFYPIHIASAKGYVEIVKELLANIQFGYDLCLLKDGNGNTPLDYAIFTEREDVIHELRSAQEHIKKEHINNRRLNDAAQVGDLKVLKELLAEDSNILDRIPLQSYETPLHVAVLARHTEFVREIIKRRPQFAKASNIDGDTPMHLAAASGYVEIIKELFSLPFCSSLYFLHVNRRGRLYFPGSYSPSDIPMQLLSTYSESIQDQLHDIRIHQPKSLKILMERLIENELLNTQDWDGNTSVLRQGYVEIVKELLRQDGSSNLRLLKEEIEGGTGDPLHFAVIKGTISEYINIVIHERLSTSPECKNRELTAQGQTVLHPSVDDNSKKITLKVLLRSRAMIELLEVRDFRGKTVFDLEEKNMREELNIAAKNGDLEALDELIAEDPRILDRIPLDSITKTPLHTASEYGQTYFATEIIRRRPEFAKQFNKGIEPPINLASANGHVETVKALLRTAQFDPCLSLVQDWMGYTAFHCAAMNGRTNVIKELRSTCWKCVEKVSDLGETALFLALENKQYEAFKTLVEGHIMDELLNTDDWDVVGNMATGYVEILKELLNQVDSKLHLTKEMKGHFAVIKGKMLSTTHPEYIRKVTAQGQMVLQLVVDENPKKITFKVLLKNPMVVDILDAKDAHDRTIFYLVIPQQP